MNAEVALAFLLGYVFSQIVTWSFFGLMLAISQSDDTDGAFEQLERISRIAVCAGLLLFVMSLIARMFGG